MKETFTALVTSRKVWLTLISCASAIAMYRSHGIDASQLANILALSSGVLVFAIAHEDHGAKSASTTVVNAGGPTTIAPTTATSDDTQPVAAPSVAPKGS